MHSVSDVQTLIRQHARALPPRIEPLSTESLGLVLAQDVAADLDSPPFDKALMDGYAVRSADLPAEQGLTLVGEIVAGSVDSPIRLEAGQTVRIMTGAPIPVGADAVVMIEHARCVGDRVRFDKPVLPGQHVLPRAAEMRADEVVLRAGTLLRPQEFGMLATLGRTSVLAYPRPRVAVIATGDEIIDPARRPRPGQIRNSNGPMLAAQTARAGGLPRSLGIARDSREHLRSLIGEGLETAAITLLAGGVSMGSRDLVPAVLSELGATIHVHKVALKPGKPLLVASQADRWIFGLPGNPLSAFVGFELFVRPVLNIQRGLDPGPVLWEAQLARDFADDSDRPTYHPARLARRGSVLTVEPSPWFGSADLRSYLAADALLPMPPGPQRLQAGQCVTILPLT